MAVERSQVYKKTDKNNNLIIYILNIKNKIIKRKLDFNWKKIKEIKKLNYFI